MKSLDHYKSLHYKVVIDYDAEDSVFVVRFPELPGCVADGETEAEALSLALKMKDSWLETAYNTGWDMPEPRKPVEANGRVTVRMPKSLHRDVLEMAEADGISLNQLLVTFISREVGRKEEVRKSETAHSMLSRYLEAVAQTSNTSQKLWSKPLPDELHFGSETSFAFFFDNSGKLGKYAGKARADA